MSTVNLEVKRQRIETAVKILALLVVGFFVAPFILAAIGGLIGLAISAIVGLVVINLAPSVAAMIANWRLKALKAVAAMNPIETLENQYADREAALKKIRDNITQSYAVLQSLYTQIQDHNQKFPNTPSQFTDKYEKLKQLIALRGNKYKQAQKNLADFSELIDEKRSDWKIAQTMAAANKLADVGQDFQSNLMKDTALTTVQDGLNLAFSELETSLLDEGGGATVTTQVSAGAARPAGQLSAPSSPPSSLDLGFDASSDTPTVDVEAEPVPVKKSNRRY
jgi:hypothetical protein